MGKLVIGVLVVVVVIGGYLYMQDSSSDMKESSETSTTPKPTTTSMNSEVKEFTTTAYYDDKGVWFSLKEMRVKVGDTVRVKATNTKGMHDFTVDEFGVNEVLPLNQEVTIEFVANKKGEFVFYCSVPGHRDKGQWGKLLVE